ncbi:hypothetical protein D3C80_1541130 [compost metagenome]
MLLDLLNLLFRINKKPKALRGQTLLTFTNNQIGMVASQMLSFYFKGRMPPPTFAFLLTIKKPDQLPSFRCYIN